MYVSCVIPVGGGREDNLVRCLTSLENQEDGGVDEIVLVYDGCEPVNWPYVKHVCLTKHQPGLEQPRNEGVWTTSDRADYVWFVDSDLVFASDAFVKIREFATPGGITIGPYDWLPPGITEPTPDLYSDPRWPMFHEDRWQDPSYESRGELNVGLACFSGNLLWDVKEFERIGGFWNDIHHARCEDGELGLRAVAEGVPIKVAATARGYHVDHPRNVEYAMRCNERDVPMLNARHPWVQGEGLFVVERDGKRFDQLCPACGQLINTGEYWAHRETCV